MWGRRCGTFLIAGAIFAIASPAWAILVPAVGPGTGVGRIEHAIGAVAAPGPAGAVFDGFFDPVVGSGGAMVAPGFNYPTFPGVPWPVLFENDTGAFPMTANTVYSLASPANATGFGGATTSMVGIGGGGNAGVLGNFTLFDQAPDGFSSTNIFGASVDYVNVGGPVVGRYAHFIAASAFAPVGGYVAAGVKSIIEVDLQGGTGPAFTTDFFWEPLPIIMGFDGAAGPLADVIQADEFVFNTVAQSLTFGAISYSPVLTIPAGASVRIRGTLTFVADPGASIEQIDMPPELVDDFLIGTGASQDAMSILVPEPASWAMALVSVAGVLVYGRHRRKRS